MSLDHPENRAAAAASQALEDYASTVRALDAQVRTLRRRAEAAEARAEGLRDALKDAAKGLEAVERNQALIVSALTRAGLPSSWLGAIPPKLDRARAALSTDADPTKEVDRG